MDDFLAVDYSEARVQSYQAVLVLNQFCLPVSMKKRGTTMHEAPSTVGSEEGYMYAALPLQRDCFRVLYPLFYILY